ncbi:hypothetical protein Cantr_10666 [Candida viswanathii]|uniref:GIT Spa2 homology (SHD) domain-containing protein n=1 Tax=Candida viswanathii TaxID=5486 RepID=A0A367YE90_9ASCO|nr:hypothetical protein Cantr_10666 [Candida viswanathii]
MSEKDLVHHYKVLKQFLAISDDQQSRAKSNSSRAQRAREKLLKLSSAQFKELSTDVYDELKRRIDESRSEPDYLLPKTSFHPKRNQARQKLASLPQTRFKDLVADISYEIERRDLHIERNLQHSYNHSVSSNGSYSQQQQQAQASKSHDRKPSLASSSHNNNEFTGGFHSRLASHHLNDHIPKQIEEEKADTQDTDETQTTSSKNITLPNAEASNQSIGIQSSQVVPTKANLTWSSDEEDEGEEDKAREVVKRDLSPEPNEAVPEPEPEPQSKDLGKEPANEELVKLESLVNELKSKLDASQLENLKLQTRLGSLQEDYDFSVTQNKSLSNELESLGQEKKEWLSKKDQLSKSSGETEELTKELERMKSINAALRLENQSLKNTSPVSRNISNSPPAIKAAPGTATTAAAAITAGAVGGAAGAAAATASSSSGDNTTPVTNPSTLPQKQLNEFLERLEQVQPNASLASNNAASSELRRQVKHWQRRYEDSRSNAIAKDIKKASASKFELKPFVSSHGLISIKLVSDAQALLETFLSYLLTETFDADILFEKISKIAVVVNEIANQGDDQQQGSNEKSAVLRETVAHSLTATRYHAIYKQLFPRYIVEKSIVEVNCALCDLVAVCKLNENSTNLRVLDIDPKTSKKLANESIAQQRPLEGKRKSLSEDFGVRPLRMANKLKVNQSQQESIPPRSVSKSFESQPHDEPEQQRLHNLPPKHASPPQHLKKELDQSSPFIDTSKDKSIKSKTTSAFTALREQREKEMEAKLSKTTANVNPALMGASTIALATEGANPVSHIPRVFNKKRSPNTSTEISAHDLTEAVQPKKKETHNVAFNDQPVSIPVNNRDIYESDSADSSVHENEDNDLNHPVPGHFSTAHKNASFGSSTSGDTIKNTISPAKDFGVNVKRNVVEESPTRVAALQSFENSALSRNAADPQNNSFQGNSSFEHAAPQAKSTAESSFDNGLNQQQQRPLQSNGLIQTSSFSPNQDNAKDQQAPLPTRSLASTHNTSFDTALDNSFDKSSAYGNQPDYAPEKFNKEEVVLQKSADSFDPDVTYKEKSSIALLASKYESGDAEGASQLAKKSPPPLQSKLSGSSHGVHELASRINSQESSPSVHNPVSPPIVKTSPTKKSILEKVKQFESPVNESVTNSPSPQKSAQEKVPFKSVRTSLDLNRSHKSVDEPKQLSEPFSAVSGSDNKKDSSSNVVAGAAAGIATGAAATAVAANTSSSSSSSSTGKGKGLFQAFKERFTGESSTQADESAKEVEARNSDGTISDNEKPNENVISTVETSPPKDVDDEIVGKLVPVQYPSKKESALDGDDDDLNAYDAAAPKPGFTSQPIVNGSSHGSVYESAESSNGTQEDVSKQPQAQTKPPATKSVKHEVPEEEDDEYEEEETEEEVRARQRQEYRKSMAAATFNVDMFDIDDPDNTLTQVLLYLEHQTVQVINTIQSLLAAIKKPSATRGELRERTKAITVVISQMTEATNTSMNQTRNAQLKEHGSWVVRSLEDCYHRMNNLCKPGEKPDSSFADKNFKQRLAGISFDIAKCTKELVKTVEEASLKEDIAYLDARLSQNLE